ncbi:hypothetical protein HMI54_011652 [Coelomomyces lativittatus]|nr:hypothetical protein HMI56_001527 [Coelomomyces lativittatus]KAJ1515812.1 hypothetical protein HMI54_011652 [Coelomomyces lativittatus]KAJ1517130.1 hypothetical protein HMI55_000565 [Coelomomyces lativittatus]
MSSNAPSNDVVTSALPTSQEPTEERMGIGKLIKSFFRGILIAFLINQAIKIFQNKNTFLNTRPGLQPSDTNKATSLTNFANAWGLDEKLDLHVYATDEAQFFNHDPSKLVYQKFHFTYGDWDIHFKKNVMVAIPMSVQNNGSFYCHVYLTKHFVSPNPMEASYRSRDVIHRSISLIHYGLDPSTTHQPKSLLSTTEPSNQTPKDAVIRNFWNTNLTINVIADTSVYDPNQLPPFYEPYLEFLPNEQKYKPILYLNDFWSKKEDLLPISINTTELPLSLQFYPITNLKFQFYLSIHQSFQTHGFPSSDIDEIKRMFMETHPGLLALTFLVTLLHSLFEMLAFKNDVQFWKGKQNLHGISVRSMIMNFIVQCIIFLYLLDHSSETSYVILLSNGISLGIEAWKITQAVQIQIEWMYSFIPIRWHIASKASYAETKKFDEQAFRYLQYFIYPSMLVYSLYSLLYQSHKGWYSFLLSTAVGFVYAFSFLQLTPQLFINYKLKSVAHMNGRTLTYKFLTTIIDDLYSFIIKMPTWHRIAVFRDDVVFLIYLYQRFSYNVDLTRPNEFGQLPEQSSSLIEKVASTDSDPPKSIELESKKEQ